MKRDSRKTLSRVEPEMEGSGRITWEKLRVVGLCIDLTNMECCVWRPLEWGDLAIDRKLGNKNTELL